MLLTSGGFMATNLAEAGSIAYQSDAARALYPATNLLLAHRTRRWRVAWTGTSGDAVAVGIDLGSAVTPTAFALIDCNVVSGSVKLTGSDDAAATASIVSWTLPLATATISGVRLWYPAAGEQATGTYGARRYWRFEFAESTLGPHGISSDLEVGTVWLGTHDAIRPESGAKLEIEDPSTRIQSYGGAEWIDALTAFRSVEFDIRGIDHATLYTLQAKAFGAASSHVLVDLHAYSPTAAIRDGGLVYGKLDAKGGVTAALNSVVENTLTLRVVEARR